MEYSQDNLQVDFPLGGGGGGVNNIRSYKISIVYFKRGFDGRQLNLLISMMYVLFVFCFLLSRITFLLLVIMLFVLGVFSNNEPFPTFSNV